MRELLSGILTLPISIFWIISSSVGSNSSFNRFWKSKEDWVSKLAFTCTLVPTFPNKLNPILWSKSKVRLLLFLGENEGLSCFVYNTPKSTSNDPWGTTSIVFPPKMDWNNLEFTYISGIKFFCPSSEPSFLPSSASIFAL